MSDWGNVAPVKKSLWKSFIVWLISAWIVTAVYIMLAMIIIARDSDLTYFGSSAYWETFAVYYLYYCLPIVTLGALLCALVQTKSRDRSVLQMMFVSVGIFTGLFLLAMVVTMAFFMGIYIVLIVLAAGIFIGLGSFLLQAPFTKSQRSVSVGGKY